MGARFSYYGGGGPNILGWIKSETETNNDTIPQSL